MGKVLFEHVSFDYGVEGNVGVLLGSWLGKVDGVWLGEVDGFWLGTSEGTVVGSVLDGLWEGSRLGGELGPADGANETDGAAELVGVELGRADMVGAAETVGDDEG